jgi:hypothetical protein
MALNQETGDSWGFFRDKFMDLAREEQGLSVVVTEEITLRRMDRLLRAYGDYSAHPEVLERGKPNQGIYCLLIAPKAGVWMCGGGVSENFLGRARLLFAHAGVVGCPKDTDPEDHWLHRLYLNLCEENSKLLLCDDERQPNGTLDESQGRQCGNAILSVCVASATFCAQLERKSLRQPESKIRNASHPVDPEIAKRAALVRLSPNTSAAEMCQIFDRHDIQLPSQWKESGFNSWVRAYRDSNYRSRIDTLISKHKKKH